MSLFRLLAFFVVGCVLFGHRLLLRISSSGVIILLSCVGNWGGLRRGAQSTVWKLILCEVFAHLVESIDRPEGELGDLDPAVVHRFSVHHNDH